MGRYKNDFKEIWVQDEITTDCIDFMEKFGLYLCAKNDRFSGYKAVTTSQMRNIFSEVKRIEVKSNTDDQYNNELSSVLLLRPKIAYATARVMSNKRESRMLDLREVLEKGLLAVKKREDFKRFSQIFEGIIAYHKVYGGKD